MKLGRWKKRVFWVLGALAISIVLLHTGSAKEGARRLLVSALGRLIEGAVAIDGLDYRLWRGEIELDGVEAVPADGSYRLSMRHVRLRVTGLPEVTLDLVEPELDVLRLPDGAKDPDPSLEFLDYLGRARIEGGVLDFASLLRFEAVNAELLESPEGRRLSLHAARGRLAVFDEEVPLGPLDGDAVLTPETIRIVSASLYRDGSFLRAEGELGLGGGFSADLEFEAALEASLARHLNEALQFRGTLTASGRARYHGNSPGVEAVVRSQEIAWRELALREMVAQVDLDGSRLDLRDVTAQLYGGRARLDASLELFDPSGERRLDASWEDVDSNALYLALTGDALPMASRVSGELHARLEDWRLSETTGSAQIRLTPAAAVPLPSLTGRIDASFDSGAVEVRTEALALSRPRVTSNVEGRLGLDGAIDLRISAALESSSIETFPFAAEGFITAEGRLAGTLPNPTWSARLSSRELRWTGEPFALSGSLYGDTTSAWVDALSLEGRGGRVEAEGEVPLDAAKRWDIAIAARELGLPALGPLSAVVAEANLRVVGAADAPEATAAMRLAPLSLAGREGEARLSMRKVGDALTLDELHAEVAGGTLDGSASYALDSEAIDASLTLDALDIEGIVEGLTGVASLNLSLDGSRTAPSGVASFRLHELALNGEALPEAVLEARNEGADVAIRGRLNGESFLEGSLAIESPFPLHLEAPLSKLPWDELARASRIDILSVWKLRAAGTASVDAELSAPRALRYRASVDELSLTTAVSTATSSPFVIEGDLEGLSVRRLALEGPQGHVRLYGEVPFTGAGELDLGIDARVPLDNLRGLSPDLEARGEAIADVTVAGPMKEPRIEGSLEIADSDGRFKTLVWSGVSFSARASPGRLESLELRGSVLDGHVALEGQVPLQSGAAPGRLDVALAGVDLAPLLSAGDREEIALLVTLAGELDVTELSLSGITGRGELEELSLRGRDRNIDLTEPASWRLGTDRFELSPMKLRGKSSELTIDLRALDLALEPRLEASLAGAVDLALIDELLGDRPALSTGGRGDLMVEVAYSEHGLELSGEGAISGGRLAFTEPRFTLSNLSAGFELDGERLNVTSLSASVGPGRLQGGGFIDLTPEAFRADLSAQASDIALELVDGLRVETSGAVRLASVDGGALELSGNLLLDRGLLTREIDEEDFSVSGGAFSLRDPTESRDLASRLSLDLTLATRRNLVVENSLAQLELAGSISLRGTLAAPDVGGTVTALPDGTIRIGRNQFQIIQGRADLRGFPATPPRLDLVAVTRVGQNVIQISVEGDVDDLRTRLTAPDNPNLTEGDLASLLVTGRTLEQAGQGGQQIASTWMMSSLANLMHQGLGELITYGPPPGSGPLILAEETDPTSRLTLGVPVTGRLSATYSIALDDAEKRLWILDYRLARNIWLRAVQQNGSDYSVGVSQRFNLDLRGAARASRRLPGETGARIAGVSVQGVPEGFEWTPRLRPGDRYDYWATQDQARKLTRGLVERGYPSAVVEVTAEPGEAEGVEVVLSVSAGKPTRFEWSGDDPGKDLRQSIERAWDGRIPEPFLRDDLAQSVRTRLAAKRYYLARVETRVEEEDKARQVVFDVTRGPRGRRVELRFEGNESMGEAALREALPPADSAAFFVLLERPAELERGIRLRYASEGFLSVSLGEIQQAYDAEAGSLGVTIPIQEGPRTRVAELTFEGSTAFEPERLGRALGVAVGDPVDLAAIRRGEATLRTLYREEGFPDVRLRSALGRVEEGVAVQVGIEEGHRARVGDIRIVGNVRSRESVIRHELTFERGAPLRSTDLQESQKRLYDLGVFRTADVRTDPTQAGETVQDVIIQIIERPDLDVNYGLRYNAFSSQQSIDEEAGSQRKGLEVLSQINVVNPLGLGSNVGFSIFLRGDYQLYRGTLRIPTPLGKRITTEITLDTDRDQDRLDIPGFDLRRDRLAFQQTKKLTDDRYDKLALQWNVSYARYRGQTVEAASGEIVTLEASRPRLGIAFIEDRRDSFANPTRGRFWNVSLQYSPKIWGSNVSFYRLFGQLFYYVPLGRKLVWASGVRLGFAPGERPFQLIDDRFQAGGPNSVRGFRQNALGPSVTVPETGKEIFIGGQAVAVLNQELRFPLYKALHGGVFWDAGNVFARLSDFRIPDLRQSVGAGLRYVLSFGAVRLDWARVLDPREGESSSRLHFSFGYAF